LRGQVQKGKIVLVPFPFTDMTDTKIRPALVLHVGNRDATVAFISSKIPNFADEAEVSIKREHFALIFKISRYVSGFKGAPVFIFPINIFELLLNVTLVSYCSPMKN